MYICSTSMRRSINHTIFLTSQIFFTGDAQSIIHYTGAYTRVPKRSSINHTRVMRHSIFGTEPSTTFECAYTCMRACTYVCVSFRVDMSAEEGLNCSWGAEMCMCVCMRSREAFGGALAATLLSDTQERVQHMSLANVMDVRLLLRPAGTCPPHPRAPAPPGAHLPSFQPLLLCGWALRVLLVSTR